MTWTMKGPMLIPWVVPRRHVSTSLVSTLKSQKATQVEFFWRHWSLSSVTVMAIRCFHGFDVKLTAYQYRWLDWLRFTFTTGSGSETVRSAVVWSAENLDTYSSHFCWARSTKCDHRWTHVSLENKSFRPSVFDGVCTDILWSSRETHRILQLQMAVIVLAVLFGVLILGLLLWPCLRRREPAASEAKATSSGQKSYKWAEDDGSVIGQDPIGSPHGLSRPAPQTSSPPS